MRPLVLRFDPETLNLESHPLSDNRCHQVLLRRWNNATPAQRWAWLGPAESERLRSFIAECQQFHPDQVSDCVLRFRLTGVYLIMRLTAWPASGRTCAHCLTVRLSLEDGWATRHPEIEQIAHDLRNGLQSLTGLAHLAPGLPTSTSSQPNPQWASALRASVAYVADLADGLELAARSSGRRANIQRSVHVCQLLTEIRDYFLPQAQAKRVRLSTSCCYELQAHVIRTDASVLRRVLHNLVGNALKYIRTGEVMVEAQLLNGERLEVRIKDTGPGLAPKQRQLAFRPYIRLSTSRGTEGSGLGLAIVRHIVERAGGAVELFSQLGEGTELVVQLPARPG
jgi:light-regulated signal transduction histidine kinase (bacteriophytochrome)